MIARTFEHLLPKRLTLTSERISLTKQNALVVAKIYPRKLKPIQVSNLERFSVKNYFTDDVIVEEQTGE